MRDRAGAISTILRGMQPGLSAAQLFCGTTSAQSSQRPLHRVIGLQNLQAKRSKKNSLLLLIAEQTQNATARHMGRRRNSCEIKHLESMIRSTTDQRLQDLRGLFRVPRFAISASILLASRVLDEGICHDFFCPACDRLEYS
jgi:hypothetical protein